MRNRRDKYARAGTQSLLPTPITKDSVYNSVQIYRDYLREKFCFFSPNKRRHEVPDTNLGQIYPKINYFFPPQPQNLLLNGLIAYWSLNNTTNDLTSPGYNLTASNTSFTTGIISSGLNCTQAPASCAYNSDISCGNSFSVSCWTKFSDKSNNPAIWGTGKNQNLFSGQTCLNLDDFYGILNLYVGAADFDGSSYILGPSVNLNQWYNIICTFSPNYIVLYVNGVNVASETASDVVNIGDNSFSGFALSGFLGTGQIGAFPLTGVMDEVGVWSRPLTQEEVTSLYNSGAAKAYPFS